MRPFTPTNTRPSGGDVAAVFREAGRHAFTLLETVIVLALILILAIFLGAGAQNLQRGARTAKCLSQLRTLWGGMMFFVQDHDGKFPSINIEKSANDKNTPGFREYVGYTGNLFEDTLYSCPEAQRGEGGKFAAGGNMNRSYSVNRLMVYNWASPDSNATVVNGALGYYIRVLSPQKGLYLVDGVPNPGSTSPTASGKGINYYSNVNASNAFDLRELHNGKLNAIYLDGHAATLNRTDLERPKDDVQWGAQE